MIDELTELRQRIHNLSDGELWQMVNVDSAQYRRVALDYAKSEIKERGLSLDRINSKAEIQTEGVYSVQWEDYRRRRNLFWIVFLTYIPGILIIGIPLACLFHSNVVGPIVAGLWMLAFIVVSNYWGFWKCPRCGKPFFRKWWYHNSFARRCVHCKLPKWAVNDFE